MPRTGVPTDVSRAATHTGTEQWQSFEIRMRHRRADRCLLRAEAALDAGLEAEARAALDEARGLNPGTPSFDELLAAARLRREADAAGQRRQRTRRAALIATAGLVVILGIGWAVVEWREATEVETLASAPEPIARPLVEATNGARAPQSSETQPPGPAIVHIPPASSAVARRAEPAASSLRAAPSPPRVVRERTTERSAADVSPSVAVEPPSPAPPASPQTTTETVARLPVDASLLAGALGAPVSAAMNVPTPASTPAPVPDATSRPPEPALHEPAVRAVLARFAEAYSSLSAAAARQVWPSVDARSLSRAFEGLESQQVSLGICSVKVAASTARAECSGSATWAPKIGGGRRTEARRWEFDLARTNGIWIIVQARAR